ncbi:hypothetical protein SEVIR_2G262900v4 [Setaria viridis]|uniref:Uncharacterized protein n=1 Tax=Setaria viridis TaxID=4556 RepID=A0A4U6VWG9_SETVI|nr:hypothetical protein SEVIR_2G262900v2 [Setaria viridis]
MTCEHVICVLHDMVGKYHLWVRYFHGDEDALATVKYENEFTNLALLDALQVKTFVPPTTLQFSKKRKIRIEVVLLGYFNPPSIDRYFKRAVIAKDPNSVQGKIT